MNLDDDRDTEPRHRRYPDGLFRCTLPVMLRADTHAPSRSQLLLCALVITIISFFTYVRGYDQPNALFWDENYHIASAQRYLNGVYFLEPHPPLGKLLIALGELVLSPNEKTDHFLDVEYGPGEALPFDFSFAGYRLFPTLLAWLTAPLLLLTTVTITSSLALGLLVSALYTFDNAIIVHSRSAMLESTQLFFMALALVAFFTLAKRPLRKIYVIVVSAILGVALGATMATKVTSVLLAILLPLVLALRNLSLKTRTMAMFVATLSCVVVYFGVWRAHFLLGERRIEALAESGYFSLSEDVRAIVDSGQQTRLASFPRMWWENGVTYLSRYADGVPKLDLSKGDENGSPMLFWPIGARAIQYRWEAAPKNSARYLFLVSNPFGWGIALGAVVLCVSLIIARGIFPTSVKLKEPLAIGVLMTLYVGYFVGVGQITRVMYLYHYFVPLLCGFLLAGLALNEVDTVGPCLMTQRRKRALVALGALGACVTFLWYSPLTYYNPMTDAELRSRAILSVWDLTCAGCPRTNKLVQPPAPSILTVRFGISELAPEEAQQDWGQPQIGVSAVGRPLIAGGVEYPTAFGMHSNSILSYPVYKQYSRFTGDVGLPDYLIDSKASVTFKVYGDDQLLWESPLMRPGMPMSHIDVDISQADYLVLKMLDGDDGITDDHGFWAQLSLTPKPGGALRRERAVESGAVSTSIHSR